MRKPAQLLHRWVNPTDEIADTLEVVSSHDSAIYGVCLVNEHGVVQPINLRTVSDYGAPSYLRVAHGHPGHSVNLADRLNARFQ